MNGKFFRSVAPASVLTLTAALVVSMNTISTAQTWKETRWCNAYASPVFHAKSEQGVTAVKIKYGKSFDGEVLNLTRALHWWASYVIDPSEARSKKVIHFVPVSAFNESTLRVMIAAAGKHGNVKPYVAMAASPRALISAGIDLPAEISMKKGLLTAPIWWNRQMEGIFETALQSIKTDPIATRRSIGKIAAYTVNNSVNYDPESTFCNPPHKPAQDWDKIDVLPENLDEFYIGVSGAPNWESAREIGIVKVLMGQGAWPTKDD